MIKSTTNRVRAFVVEQSDVLLMLFGMLIIMMITVW